MHNTDPSQISNYFQRACSLINSIRSFRFKYRFSLDLSAYNTIRSGKRSPISTGSTACLNSTKITEFQYPSKQFVVKLNIINIDNIEE